VTMQIRLTQVDGKLPNLALMKLARFHGERGDEVHFTRSPYKGLLEPRYDRVYGSAIFSFSSDRVQTLKAEFPDAIVGGTWNVLDPVTVEDVIGDGADDYDYSPYPDFTASIGFTQRGCRLKCGFCVVPKKEGKARSVNTIADIWRGPPHPKHLHLLDNDFFGQPRADWEARVAEIIDGDFKVCFNQGINIRMIGHPEAAALTAMKCFNDQFDLKCVYCAWDNVGDEVPFFRGVDLLEKHGFNINYLRVYMLVGYDRRETWERLLYRFHKMTDRGIRPYPMIYGDRRRTLPLGGLKQNIGHRTLAEFQRWVIRRSYAIVPFEDYDAGGKGPVVGRQADLFAEEEQVPAPMAQHEIPDMHELGIEPEEEPPVQYGAVG
jgi:hypothetical protein